jgi:hypothetical protein
MITTIYTVDFGKCFYWIGQWSLYSDLAAQINMDDFWMIRNQQIDLIINKKSVARIRPDRHSLFAKDGSPYECSELEYKRFVKKYVNIYIFEDDFEQLISEDSNVK